MKWWKRKRRQNVHFRQEQSSTDAHAYVCLTLPAALMSGFLSGCSSLLVQNISHVWTHVISIPIPSTPLIPPSFTACHTPLPASQLPCYEMYITPPSDLRESLPNPPFELLKRTTPAWFWLRSNQYASPLVLYHEMLQAIDAANQRGHCSLTCRMYRWALFTLAPFKRSVFWGQMWLMIDRRFGFYCFDLIWFTARIRWICTCEKRWHKGYLFELKDKWK